MPKGNRQSTANSLRTTNIWAKTIGQTHAAGFGDNEVESDHRRRSNKGIEGDAEFERMKAILRQSKASRDGKFVDDGRGRWKGKKRLKGQFVPPPLLSGANKPSATASNVKPGSLVVYDSSDFSSSSDEDQGDEVTGDAVICKREEAHTSQPDQNNGLEKKPIVGEDRSEALHMEKKKDIRRKNKRQKKKEKKKKKKEKKKKEKKRKKKEKKKKKKKKKKKTKKKKKNKKEKDKEKRKMDEKTETKKRKRFEDAKLQNRPLPPILNPSSSSSSSSSTSAASSSSSTSASSSSSSDSDSDSDFRMQVQKRKKRRLQ